MMTMLSGPGGHSHGVIIINLALGKHARQSSSDTFLFALTVAQRAVDGNTDGLFLLGSVSSTLEEDQPWWEVDLEVESRIFSVFIYNRADCCKKRLTNFDIKFYDNVQRPVNNVQYGCTIALSKYQIGFDPSVVARYVRIQLRDRNILSLAEVQVLGYVLGDQCTSRDTASSEPSSVAPTSTASTNLSTGSTESYAKIIAAAAVSAFVLGFLAGIPAAVVFTRYISCKQCNTRSNQDMKLGKVYDTKTTESNETGKDYDVIDLEVSPRLASSPTLKSNDAYNSVPRS